MRQSDTREHLLTTGLRILHAGGFNGSGVQEIIEAAGVPKGSFYNHFDSKEQFGADVLGRYWEERASRAAALLSDESHSPLGRLQAYFSAKRRTERTATFDRGCMIGNFSAELSGQSRLVRDRLAAVFAAWTCLLATCIQEAQRAGQVGADIDAETLAAFLIDAFEGAVLRTKVDRDPTALMRFERIVFSKLLV
jgi:TetR/AcrR family transcriptional repressor of nem operon